MASKQCSSVRDVPQNILDGLNTEMIRGSDEELLAFATSIGVDIVKQYQNLPPMMMITRDTKVRAIWTYFQWFNFYWDHVLTGARNANYKMTVKAIEEYFIAEKIRQIEQNISKMSTADLIMILEAKVSNLNSENFFEYCCLLGKLRSFFSISSDSGQDTNTGKIYKEVPIENVVRSLGERAVGHAQSFEVCCMIQRINAILSLN